MPNLHKLKLTLIFELRESLLRSKLRLHCYLLGLFDTWKLDIEGGLNYVPYESPILGQLLDIISLPKINISEPRFKSYDPWDMTN